jgi:hypothetical protein
MSILNLNGPSGRAPRSNGAVKVWMGIGLVIAVLGVGSTLASTITINSNNTAEFGQGVQRTVYCGGNKEITVTPVSKYINTPEPLPSLSSGSSSDDNNPPTVNSAGSFYLSAIKVSEIPSQCTGVDFVISVYNQVNSDPVEIAVKGENKLITPTVYWVDKSPEYGGILSRDRDGYVGVGDLATLVVNVKNDGKGSFEIQLKPGIEYAPINDVGRIVIETQNDTFGPTVIDHRTDYPLTVPLQ